MDDQPTEPISSDMRERILDAASHLVDEGGVTALTTRAIASAASVQAPALYRLFGDKRGLLEALAEHDLAAYAATKAQGAPHPDPIQALRDGWDAHIAFSLSRPAVFAIMNEVGRRPSPATEAGLLVLRGQVRRVAQSGRLRVPEARAVAMMRAAANGTIATLLATPEESRDMALSSAMRDAIITALIDQDTVAAVSQSVEALAVSLRSHLGERDELTAGERLLMEELLNRIAS